MMSATQPSLSPWAVQNSISSGTRAMVPSSDMISQITPADFNPASLQRSTEPSVWPARTSTPPSWARSGKTWPGRTRSSGALPSETSSWVVVARSSAEIPVETPSRASTETVNAVPWRASLASAWG